MHSKAKAANSTTLAHAAALQNREKYVLRLYIAGMTPTSVRAIANVKNLCTHYLEGRYELKVIDIFRQPLLARGEEVIATPTLIKELPLPLRKLVGDMSDTARLLIGIDLQPEITCV
jgi:circadian clock protein KaiB